MEKLIKYENIRSFAYVNDKICKSPIKGIVIYFFGLNWNGMFKEDTPEGIAYAEEGILYVVPYNNPWAWMNKQAVNYTDEIIDALVEQYDLPQDIPIVSTGKSMGGMSSIIYCSYAKRTPVACVANCPVCDMVFHFTEREDLPRTIYSAYYNESGTLDDALKAVSPLHLAEKLPKIRYHIFHCENDMAVNLQLHSEKFVNAMQKLGRTVTFDIIPERGHCDLPEEAEAKFKQYCIDAVNQKA